MQSEFHPSASVVIVNLNRREMLVACLASLRVQSLRGFEVVVVDNGSADGSAEAVRRFDAGGTFSIRVVENSENRGFCGGNNQGIAASRGELVALLNNDAEAEASWLESLRAPFQDPAVGMTASKILVWEDPGRIDKAGHLMYPDGQNRGRGTGEIDRGQYDREEEVLWPDGCAAMYRRSMLEEIGGFDEDFFAYADDAELGLRARVAGWRCVYVPGAVVRHHRGATLGLASPRRLELIERNRALLAVKHFPPGMLAAVPLWWTLRVGAGIVAALRGRGETRRFPGAAGKWVLARSILRANLEAAKMVPSMLRKRQELRRIRRLDGKQIRELLLRHRISLKALTEQAN